MVINLLRLPSVLNKRAKSKSAHYLDIQEGLCTKSVLTGVRSVAWPEHEIDALNAARIAGMDDSEIRSLVSQLEAERKTLANRVEAK
ncbi:MAG: AlpA family phage regulatory protein [Chloroflexi bacterium]|nr:AlpA family phage regulatory protein [Chloroflexota bacterium]